MVTSTPEDSFIRDRVLPRFDVASDAHVEALGNGLINQTFAVTEPQPGGRRFVLQRVNPLFPASIHDNILAVTTRLREAGLTTPRLVPTDEGAPCLQLAPLAPAAPAPAAGAEVWRLMSFIDGVSFDVVGSPGQARAAGALIAHFHRALEGLAHPFTALRTGVHDTPRHLETLARAAAEHVPHRLHGVVGPIATEIAAAAAALPALPALAPRVCHGDLKFNNVLFAGAGDLERERAVCLIDLDTVGPMSLAFELGDAWRSWCNRSGEDDVEAALDLEIFEASLDGYSTALGSPLDRSERQALLLGPEWISLELAARFAADALDESYFGWDPMRFPGRGEHNLVRARGQLSLHHAFVATRSVRARLLAVPPH
jgi:Ser/Thr protein kinase RdoA (MazF antagonist)